MAAGERKGKSGGGGQEGDVGRGFWAWWCSEPGGCCPFHLPLQWGITSLQVINSCSACVGIACCKFILLTAIIHCLKERKKKRKKGEDWSVSSTALCKKKVLHLPIPLFISLLFPLGSKHPICSFLIIHSSTKRFCLLFILRCDIFFMLEMFGMPLKVAKIVLWWSSMQKESFWVECLLSNTTSTSLRFSPVFTVCES